MDVTQWQSYPSTVPRLPVRIPDGPHRMNIGPLAGRTPLYSDLHKDYKKIQLTLVYRIATPGTSNENEN